MLFGDLDPSADVRSRVVGDDASWWTGIAVRGDMASAEAALAAAGMPNLQSLSAPVRVEMAVGFLLREDSASISLETLRALRQMLRTPRTRRICPRDREP